MSSTTFTIYHSIAVTQRRTYPQLLRPFFVAILGVAIIALTMYLMILYQSAAAEQTVKKAGLLIMELEEQNSQSETRLSQQDNFLQSEEKLATMELVKSNGISYIEKTSGVLVQR